MSQTRDFLKDGSLARAGLLSDETIDQASVLIAEVAASTIETVRVLFADQHGVLLGKTIVSSALPSLFTSGLKAPNTLLLKDTSHRTAFPIWSDAAAGLPAGAGDILLVPDPATFRRLPWTDTSSWIFCTPLALDGTALPYAARSVLQSAIDRLAGTGRQLKVGLEVEFHIFAVEDARLAHDDATMPGAPVRTRNVAQGYQFLTEQIYDKVEPLLDDLRRHAQTLGLPLRSLEIEMGPSQFEFTFDPADPMTHADTMMMFRTLVKEVSSRAGMHATFMCKPKAANAAASGWHIHQSLCDAKGGNLMMALPDGSLSRDASAWIAGLLDHAEASCLLTTPTVNGYKRYQPHQLAPDRILWGRDNRGAMIRGLMAPDDPASRVENRVAEPVANPYYVFASQILCGLDGIERGLSAPDAVETPYLDKARRLPDSLLSAIQHFESSEFYRNTLGDVFVDYLAQIKKAEWNRYHMAVSDWEQAEYFNLF